MNVWILPAGDYSEYHLVGVFSTEENAKKYKEAYGNIDYNEPWETEIDSGLSQLDLGLFMFQVWMDRKGDVNSVGRVSPSEWEPACVVVGGAWHASRRLNWIGYAKDEQHAVKIANEKRGQLIASGEWDNA